MRSASVCVVGNCGLIRFFSWSRGEAKKNKRAKMMLVAHNLIYYAEEDKIKGIEN